MEKPIIAGCRARQILDSRGNPTVEADVILHGGITGTASVPSGASTGIHEAHERRDGDKKRFGGKGVLGAVASVGNEINAALKGAYADDIEELDQIMMRLDGTESKERLGANAILAVSLAAARASAKYYGAPLYRHLGGESAVRLPFPMMNILNGGAHATNNVDIQEFMIVPMEFASFSDALRAGSEIYHTLGGILKGRGLSTGVGDEGGFAPNLESDEAAIELIVEAIEKSGYGTDRVKIALDCAVSEWYRKGSDDYRLPKRGSTMSREELCSYLEKLVGAYPIVSIEDGMGEDDFEGWRTLTSRLGNSVMLVGDDLFVTNEKRLRLGTEGGMANSILIKPNQIGSLSQTLNVIKLARECGYGYILSHRSAETPDSAIADISVATNAPFIKTGAPCRGERIAKYNRLIRIEEMLGKRAVFGK